MKEEMRKRLIKTRDEGRMSQGIFEASMVSITDLIRQRETLPDTRMTEMSVVMKEWDRQADARLKLMSEVMQRRDSDANNRMVELMTTMHHLSFGVRAVVAQAAAASSCPTPIPMTSNSVNLPSTSAFPPAQQPHTEK